MSFVSQASASSVRPAAHLDVAKTLGRFLKPIEVSEQNQTIVGRRYNLPSGPSINLVQSKADHQVLKGALTALGEKKIWNHQHVERLEEFFNRNNAEVRVAFADVSEGPFIATGRTEKSWLREQLGLKNTQAPMLFVLPRPKSNEGAGKAAAHLANLLGIASAAITHEGFPSWSGQMGVLSFETLKNFDQSNGTHWVSNAQLQRDAFVHGVTDGNAKSAADLQPLRGKAIDEQDWLKSILYSLTR